MSLSFESTGIAKLDHLLYVMEEASHYVHDSTRWDELDWQSHLEGKNPMESINIALQDLVTDLKQHEKLIAKLKRQGFIQEES